MKITQIYLICLLILLSSTTVYSSPNVLVSIKPLHSITSFLMQGIGKPELLLTNKQSAHEFNFKISQIKKASKADLLIYIHPKFETSIKKIISIVPSIAIGDNENLIFYKLRADSDRRDWHIWLDLKTNAIEIANIIKNKLIEINLKNKNIYLNNFKLFKKTIHKLNLEFKSIFKKHKNISIATFHDAYQYFEKNYNINNVLIIEDSDEHNHHHSKLSAKKIINIRSQIKKLKPKCLLGNPEVKIKEVNIIKEDLNLKYFSVDPLGRNIPSSENHYFILLDNITKSIVQCMTD